MSTQADSSLRAAYAPISTPPTIIDGDVGTTPPDDITASVADGYAGVRRVRVVNTHATNHLGVLYAQRPSFNAGGIAASTRIMPGASFEFLINASVNISLVGSAAATTYNVTISDV
jgi:hypothetical protein